MKYDFAESVLQRESTECKGDSKEKRINRPPKNKVFLLHTVIFENKRRISCSVHWSFCR